VGKSDSTGVVRLKPHPQSADYTPMKNILKPLAASIAVAALLTACGTAAADAPFNGGGPDVRGGNHPTTTVDDVHSTTPPTAAPPVEAELKTDDFAVELTVLEEQCFDSAGSLITAEPMLYTDIVDRGDITVTYTVPVEGGTNTFSLDYDSDSEQFSYDELNLSTETCNPDLTTTVTRVG
jgi:hypothetical protein